ncbi:hypothetical protein CDD83_8414 [Cordyceps sp. RAO-2017]|nr:hypothetical protein CDD83_8414 [Cordyceps sp. RAO-2017]
MMPQLCRFQQSALFLVAELEATMLTERGRRHINLPGRVFSGAAVPPQDQVKAIKSQQMCASKEKEDIEMARADTEEMVSNNADAGAEVRFGPSTSFLEVGKVQIARLTLNKKQAIALSIICRHLDSMRQIDGGEVGQLCQFVGGEGGTGKSRVIEALVELFAAKGIASRLLITATSRTAAARVNGVTTKDQGPGANTAKDVDGVRLPK